MKPTLHDPTQTDETTIWMMWLSHAFQYHPLLHRHYRAEQGIVCFQAGFTVIVPQLLLVLHSIPYLNIS
jgi:hypothetical protein